MRLQDLDTPALVIDLDRMERNLQRVAEYATKNNLRVRPHTKTHKVPSLARKQLDLGATGLTVAKTSEGEVMLRAEPEELLVAYPVIGEAKLRRLTSLASRAKVTVALDSIEVARQISAAATEASVKIGVLAEIDVGLLRVGVAVGQELRNLAVEVDRLPCLRLEGISFYPGHIKRVETSDSGALRDIEASLKEAIGDLAHLGLEAKVISGGSTPTLFQSHLIPSMNEIRPGTYIFNDRNTALMGACSWDDCAAFIVTTVVSTSVPNRVILDGGSKTFTSDRSEAPGFGHIVDAPDAVLEKLNEEHGFVDVSHCSHKFRVGDKVRVIPNHVCVAVNLQEQIWGMRREEIEEKWAVEGRGKLQ